MLMVLLAVLLAAVAAVALTRMVTAFWYSFKPGSAYTRRYEEEEDDEEWVIEPPLASWAAKGALPPPVSPYRTSRGPMGYEPHEQPGFPPARRGFF